ncbi:unnamed protein product [Coffea canephora]|uniref:Uncharacterized protein n=1 Tax=Coffea canephora TaxID=49390 RepID=A0A068UEI9_COFCA|nr:unnamed protein product [Coffea canephora]
MIHFCLNARICSFLRLKIAHISHVNIFSRVKSKNTLHFGDNEVQRFLLHILIPLSPLSPTTMKDVQQFLLHVLHFEKHIFQGQKCSSTYYTTINKSAAVTKSLFHFGYCYILWDSQPSIITYITTKTTY